MQLVTADYPMKVSEHMRYAQLRGKAAEQMLKQWIGNQYSRSIVLDIFNTVGNRPATPGGPGGPSDQVLLQGLTDAIANNRLFLLKPKNADAASAGDPDVLADQVRAQQAQAAANRSSATSDDQKKTWFKCQLLDEDGEVMDNEPYILDDTNGGHREGKLDDQGTVYIPPLLTPGDCHISFPKIHLNPRKKKS